MVSACRTALGEFLGSLKTVQARDLAITAGAEAITRSGIAADQIDEICMGLGPAVAIPKCLNQAGFPCVWAAARP